ncbi:Nucleoside transporter FUN26 [Fulvia fulva]|uniref:Nucleoside transporter FUN26 n=1 Tax=Passalora fulva TaxID=5499 RepID=A0A9Q8LHK7_PASFU|nr:Nucleoside transporter FUN26 [Fulvia fulva]KAK4624326.1 Nucleoside transporter FUN26 [Fulvia fulva]UJO17781.1 Nucleoside transporter FUN26 [Fulvia fulva]WPV14859.1 Nucleoside transporter FUN26 [Fulvia fulva]WPV29739.1 Nucleoside transporter FUN26 [Fulvia fulva]
MERIRRLWRGEQEQEYEPLSHSELSESRESLPTTTQTGRTGFHYIEYAIFLLLGISMLWAWNMFLAAGPYFQHRFRSSPWISENFQAAEISVSTITNLGSMLVLTRMQAGASYPRRIVVSLGINMVVFSLLAASTALEATPGVYFGFLMGMMFLTSLATGFCQNGVFAFVAGFGEMKYTQGIMTGQAVAGVLPCVAQIVSVLSFQGGDGDSREPPSHDQPPGPPPVKWTAALAYFITATAISVATLFAFSVLLARNRQPKKLQNGNTPDDTGDSEGRKSIPLLYLLRKLIWLASGVFVTFAVTMVFPVFTQRIVSVRPPQDQPPILQPASFIPLALLFWNMGDLAGRMITAVPSLSLTRRPRLVFVMALLRIVWVGGYHLCNIRGEGAIVNSDFFYLVVIQLLFGMSNGYLGSTCMIAAGEWVEDEEREAAGGFMGLCLVAGLTVGSLLSFFITGT